MHIWVRYGCNLGEIILVLAVIVGSSGVISAQKHFGMQAPAEGHQWFGGAGWMSQLTEEQRDDVRQQMRMFQRGQRNATREFQETQKQEAEDFWQRISDQYNITDSSGRKFMYGEGHGFRGNKGPQKQGRGPGFGGGA